MSGVPKFADPVLMAAAVALVAQAVSEAVEAARERREAAEAAARIEQQRRMEELKKLRDEVRGRGQAAEHERDQQALARRERLRAILSTLGGVPEGAGPEAMDGLVEREQALGDLSARLTGLAADDLVARWCGRELATAGDWLARLRGGEAGDSPGATAADLGRWLDALPERARAAQEAEERRRYIAAGILEAMRESGFTVSEPALEQPGVADSALVFEGVRASGGEIAVSVPVEGQVWYAVDGYPLRLEATAGGGEASTCDEAEREILAVHALLRDRFGIRMGDLGWHGRDPARAARYADDLPTGGGARHDAWGGA